jgi:hypothetical protein
MMEILHVHREATRKVVRERLGKDFLTASEKALHWPDIEKEVITRIKSKYEETGSLKEAADYDLERGIKVFSDYVRKTTTLDYGVRAVLEAQLILAWTAFETLAEDLWKGAQELHSTSLAPQGYFRRLDSIKDAYASFSAVNVTINGYPKTPTANINVLFSKPDLRKLNLIRNLLVHKAGIVDQIFLSDTAKIDWIVPDQLGQPVQLDGLRVRELINPVIEAGQKLIRSVDCWMNLKTQGY